MSLEDKTAAVPSLQNSLTPQNTYLPDPQALTLKQMKTIFGDSGTQRWSGFFYEEFNAMMRDQSRIQTMETMRRTDGAVKAALNAMKAPILAADFRIEGEDPEICDFVEDSLFHMRRSWKDFLRESLCFFDFGFYAFEIIWEVRDGNVVVADLAPRIPNSIFRWRTSNGNPGITQIIRTDEFKLSYAEIPIDKLLVLTNDKEGDDITGQSVLRAAYKHFKNKDTLYRIQGIAAERHGVGIPVITMPDGYGDADKSLAAEFASNMRSNEQGFLVLPSEKWKAEILTPKTNPHGDGIQNAIEHHNNMILMTILANFLNLGNDGTGSLALSKDQSSFFLKHVEDKCAYFCEQITEQVIRKMVALNFGEDADVPELKFGPLGDENFLDMSNVFKNLAEAGLIKNDATMTQYIHKTFKLPEITDDDVAAAEEDQNPVEAPAHIDVENPDASPKTDVDRVPNEPTNPPDLSPNGPFNPAAALPALDADNKASPGNQKIGLDEKKNCIHLAELPYKPWRKLTLQEQRTNFEQLNEHFNKSQKNVQNEIIAICTAAILEVITQAEQKLKIGDYNGLGIVSGNLSAELSQSLTKAISEAHNYGRSAAVSELRKATKGEEKNRPALTDQQQKMRDLEVAVITAGIIGNLEKTAQQTIVNAMNADAAIPAIIATVRDNMNDVAERMAANVAGTTIGQAINRGRKDVFDAYVSHIVKFQRSEVLDDVTCLMCMSLDGRVVKADDPIANLDIVHTNCRGVWIPISIQDDTENPVELDPVPQSVLDNFELIDGRPVVNSFKNLKKAIPSAHD